MYILPASSYISYNMVTTEHSSVSVSGNIPSLTADLQFRIIQLAYQHLNLDSGSLSRTSYQGQAIRVILNLGLRLVGGFAASSRISLPTCRGAKMVTTDDPILELLYILMVGFDIYYISVS